MSRSLAQIEALVKAGDTEAFYSSSYWRAKREQILKRDNHSCQRCLGRFKVEGKPINRIKLTRAKYVHHIVELKQDFSKALDDDNLVSLCFRCHEIIHDRDAFKQINSNSVKKESISDEKW